MIKSFVENKNRCRGMLTASETAMAISELNEPKDDEERLRRIDNLRTAFMELNNDYILYRTDDSFLLRFLRAKKFHHGNALQMLTNYHIQRVNWPEVFYKVKDPSLVKNAFESGCCFVLKGRAKDGSIVCVSRPGKFKCITDWLAVLVITYERLLEEELVQIYGVTSIDDMTYISFGLIYQLLAIINRMGALFMDSMPLRLRSMNVVYESTLFHLGYTIARPLLKKKVRDRTTLHGQTFEKLHDIIDPSVLPPLYGGTGKTVEEMVAWWKNKIYS